MNGQSLRFGHEHFPAPTKLTIGKAPSDLIFFPQLRRRVHQESVEGNPKEGNDWKKKKDKKNCKVHWHRWFDHFHDCLDQAVFKFNSSEEHFSLANDEAREMDRKLFPTR